ncbi:hypothetical protein [Flavobacterium sp. N502536]|uniref:hypothetical protein n=1 Tax=Flavobacterium sp. N502536 TaxID=2986837 RepID=UPI0022218FA7|nr:hypothetical protein [Flavobacterium sp. N502536]
MIEKIIKLCTDFNGQKSAKFEGIGLVVYNDFDDLPVIPLNEKKIPFTLPVVNYENILKVLIEVSSSESIYQDGFHLLSEDLSLTHISQYFSTPIKKELKVKNNYGSRYRTALYGSLLPNVIYTIVISKDYGIVIFSDGKELFTQKSS